MLWISADDLWVMYYFETLLFSSRILNKIIYSSLFTNMMQNREKLN